MSIELANLCMHMLLFDSLGLPEYNGGLQRKCDGAEGTLGRNWIL